MIFAIPVTLIVAYALFRVFEHLGLKVQRAVYADGPRPETLRPLLFLGAILLPARIFGWVALLYYGYQAGWLAPVKLIAIAFPLSLVFQFFAAGLHQLPRSAFNVIVLGGVPAMAIVIALILASA
ncbi:MAG TPA: hypothetical protein VJL28_14165 [Gemmatimonadaceae bacterium]|nr:hypothetical protein [Gemmatimonadaceae bacterium]